MSVSLGYPVVLHWTILVVLLGLLVFAAFKHLVPLLAATVFLLVLAILPRLQSRSALRNITVKMALSHDRVFPDETIEVTLELDNRGWTLPWLEIEVELPCRLITGKKPSSPYNRERRRWVTAISRGQVITWKYPIETMARGDYQLGPLRLRSGDMLGLFPKELVLTQFQNLLVYPRIFTLNKLNFPLRSLLGERATPRSFYEDVSRVAGAREYRFDDPFKHIHWKASAAHGELQTRQYESSTSLRLLLILDVDSYQGQDEEFEYAVSMVASMAYEAERQGFAVGLVSNSDPEVRIPIGTGRTQLMLILEALARISDKSQASLYRQMDRLRTILPAGATLVAVTLIATPAFSGLASRFEKDGYSFLLVSTENKSPNLTPVDKKVYS